MKQLAVFFVLAYGICWTVWLPLYGHIFGLAHLPVLPLHHALGALGPLIAALLTTWIFQKRQGVKKLLHRCVQARPLWCLAVAMFSPFVLALIAVVMAYFTDGTAVSFSGWLTTSEFPQFNWLTFFVYNLLFFGFGEEVGWRGFALPRLQNGLNALTAALVLTVFWALWHWPLFFYRPGYTNMNAAAIAGWFFSLLTGSVLLSWLYNSSRGSILVCAVFHTTIDVAFTADVADKNIVNYMGFLITVWGILTIVVFKPKNLAKVEREKVAGAIKRSI